MNIFRLSNDPIIAASMHCDQHLGKMILESAQMLSTIAWNDRTLSLPLLRSAFYKPTHPNHPCTIWLAESRANQRWVISLCTELDNIRMGLGKDAHNSSDILAAFYDIFLKDIASDFDRETPAHFCGPAIFGLNANLPTIPDKYRAFYAYKAKRWALDGKQRMSYNGRTAPDFLQGNEYVHS